MLLKIWRVRQPLASHTATKNFRQNIKNMFKFCSYPKTAMPATVITGV